MRLILGVYKKEYRYTKVLKRKNRSFINAFKENIKKCQSCGYSKKGESGKYRLQVAHIMPFRLTPLDVEESGKLNFFILCANCHDIYDNGTLEDKKAIHTSATRGREENYVPFEDKISKIELEGELKDLEMKYDFCYKTTRSGNNFFFNGQKSTRSGRCY